MIRAVAGVLAVLGYCVVMVGVNLPNPLVPLYTDSYGLSPLAQSAVFSLYLLALVVTLLSVLRARRWVPEPGWVLLAALGLCALSDLLMAWGAEVFAGLLAGRLAAGVSVGLATGSAATLALSALGERARTVVASGAVIGSLFGNVGGGLLGTLLSAPQHTVFVVHLLVTSAVAVGLFLTLGSVRTAPGHSGGDPAVQVSGLYRPRHRRAALVLGAMSWSVAGVILALVPADLRATLPSISLLEAVLPGGVFLATAWVAQVVGRRHLLQLRAWQLSVPLVLGTGLIAIALESAHLGLLIAGAVICGLGQGPAYSLGLATVTYGLRALEQGRAASAYAAVAYGTCGAATTATGALALATGVPTAITTLTAGLAVAGLVAAAFAGAPQRIHLTGHAATG